jgi:Putative prokaryotic signal transducing protein
MKELRRSSDLVYVSWVRATLLADGIDCTVLDEHISGIEGGINAFPRRIMVDDEVFDDARTLLQTAEATLNGA